MSSNEDIFIFLEGITVFAPKAKSIDQLNAESFLEPIREVLNDTSSIVLDMSNVRFLNSTGLGAIVNLVKEVTQIGNSIRIAAPMPTVKALFRMVRLENIVGIDDKVDDSIACIKKSHESK